MPTGTVPTFVMRFDSGSVPVGFFVFSSEPRAIAEIQDMALMKLRPLFSPGHFTTDHSRARKVAKEDAEVCAKSAAPGTKPPKSDLRTARPNSAHATNHHRDGLNSYAFEQRRTIAE